MKRILHLLFLGTFIQFSTVTFAQVTLLSNNSNIEEGITIDNKTVMVTKDNFLWVTDGTPAGTAKLNVTVTVDESREVAVLNNKVYFSGNTAANGSELWVTDGTAAGTMLVKDIQPGAAASLPSDLYVFNNAIYFFATTTANGTELWKSDGTTIGTVMLKDINAGANGSYGSSANFFDNNNILYFSADDGSHGNELWKTNGTTAGTVLVKDINPGSKTSDISNLTAYNTSVVFTADDGTHGAEPWITNGTTAGTTLIKDLVTIPTIGSTPSQFMVFKNKVLFMSIDLLSGSGALYSTDGTSGGTTLLKNLFGLLINGIVMNNKLYFAADDGSHGTEIWSTDGTAAGTTLFYDINSGENSSECFFLPDYSGTTNIEFGNSNLYNGKIFFIANDGSHGTELWITDGTLANTKMVKDINPGGGSSYDENGNTLYFYSKQGLYFSANDGSSGNELWKSDGTAVGTTRVIDLNSGAKSSNPALIAYLNNHLLFAADNGDNANGFTDLYRLDATLYTLPVSLLDFTAVQAGKAVDLKWSTTKEINTSYFDVERSKDGAQFEYIGKVNAVGNSRELNNYTFNDMNAFSLNAEKIFYRLKIADKDGKLTYSPVALINFTNDARSFYAYPVPAKDHINVVLNSNAHSAEIKITDQAGKQVLSKQISIAQNGSQTRINVANLKSGVYYLQVITKEGVQSTKFVKN
ncbi:MAG: ELWxxDGT repeat protein [Ilyomonas sp.]